MACRGGVCSRNKSGVTLGNQGVQNPMQGMQNQGMMNQDPNQQLKKAGFFKGAPAQFVTSSLLNPQQQQVQGNILEQLQQLLGGIGSPQSQYAGFEPIAQQARSGFFEDTIPTLAERFTSMGGGAQNSSAFQGALGKAGAGLEQGLAALRSQYGLQNQGQQQNLLSLLMGGGLGRNFENNFIPRRPGFPESLLTSTAQAIPLGLAAYLGRGS